jgi:GTP-binding protein
MDCRHPLKGSDFLLLQLACEYDRPVHIILTKADKLKRGPGNQVLLTVKKEVADMPVPVSVQLLSMPKRVGLEILTNRLNEWLSSQGVGWALAHRMRIFGEISLT